jgi:hypothetical protein
MHKIFCCCSFAIGDPDPLSPVFRVAKSTGVEPFLFGARGSAPASMRTRGTAIAHGAVQRCDSALIKSVWVGAGPNEFGNDQGLLVRVPSGRARPTIDSIMRRLCTTPVPRASVRAPGDQLLYNAGLFRRRTHMQCGIALGDVVLDPIEKILFCCLSGCATAERSLARCGEASSNLMAVAMSPETITSTNALRGSICLLTAFISHSQERANRIMNGADHMRLSQSIGRRCLLLPIASFRCKAGFRSLLERRGHQLAGRDGWFGRE